MRLASQLPSYVADPEVYEKRLDEFFEGHWAEAVLDIERLYIEKAPSPLRDTLLNLAREWCFSAFADDTTGHWSKKKYYSEYLIRYWDDTQAWFPLFVEWDAEYYHVLLDFWALQQHDDGTISYGISTKKKLSESPSLRLANHNLSG